MKKFSADACVVGVGFKHQHAEMILQEGVELPDFFEIHAENYFNPAGVNHALLRQLTQRTSLSVHGTGLGLGNHCGLDDEHLQRFKWLVNEYQPRLVSEHLCFTQAWVDGKRVHAGDLLPLVRDSQTLQICVDNIDRVQNAIGRELLVENICHYVELAGHTFDEGEFLNEICQRAGCRLLVDLNNLFINGSNFSPMGGVPFAKRWLASINPRFIAQYHVAGSSDSRVHGLLVDDHGQPVPPEIGSLLQHAVERHAVAPILVEWDTDIPTWPTLMAQAHQVKHLLRSVSHA